VLALQWFHDGSSVTVENVVTVRNCLKIKQIVSEDSCARNVFYLSDGLAGYGKYLEEQQAVWDPHKKKVEKCGSCP